MPKTDNDRYSRRRVRAYEAEFVVKVPVTDDGMGPLMTTKIYLSRSSPVPTRRKSSSMEGKAEWLLISLGLAEGVKDGLSSFSRETENQGHWDWGGRWQLGIRQVRKLMARKLLLQVCTVCSRTVRDAQSRHASLLQLPN
jgi:hypothetical protein